MTDMVVDADRIGGPDGVLDDGQVREFVVRSLAGADLDGRSVCVIVPDGTRTCPMPLLLSAVHEALHGRATQVTVLVALGTHAAMSPIQLDAHLGGPYPGLTVLNHEWWDPRTFVTLGDIDADRVAELSEGRLKQPVRVALNRAVVEHDVCLVIGPVFRTRWSASPAATSTSSRAWPARRSSTSRTGWVPSSPAPTSSAPAGSPRSGR